MPPARNALAPVRRRLLRSLVAGSAVVVSLVAPGAVATADEPAGTTVVGQLVQAWAEADPAEAAAGHSHEGPISWIQPAEGDPVLVDTAGVSGVPVGSTVAVTVGPDEPTRSGDAHEAVRTVLETEIIDEGTSESAVPTPARFTNEVTVAMVAPAGSDPRGDGTSLAQVVSTVNDHVAPFWSEQSDGAIALGVTATHDWAAATVGCEQPGVLWDEVAERVNFVPGPGKHLLIYVGRDAGCGYALAEVGAGPSAGGRLYVSDTSASAMAHEFGHNFGLGHSSAEQCDAAVEGGSCRTVAYRDYYDVMGVSWSRTGTLNAAQASLLAVLPEAHQQSLSLSGGATTVTLAALSGRTGTRALRLTDAEGVDYWLEYRAATGRDGWLAAPANRFGLETGVLLRRAGALPDTSVLLDATPSPAAGWNADYRAALPVGIAVPVSGGDFSVVVQAVSAAGAVVSVTPTPPVTPQAAVTARPGAAVDVLPAAGGAEAASTGAGPAAGLPAPEYRAAPALLGTAEVESAAASASDAGPPLPLVVAALLGATVVLGGTAVIVPRLRRLRRRSSIRLSAPRGSDSSSVATCAPAVRAAACRAAAVPEGRVMVVVQF